MENTRKLFIVIILLTLASVVIDLPKNLHIKFQAGNIKLDRVISGPELDFSLSGFRFKRDLNIKQGLDLSGGTHLVLQADMEKIDSSDRDRALESAKEVIDRRVNLYGVSEPVVQTAKVTGDYRIIVELPGIKDINQAIDLIGKTAQLEFLEEEATPSAESSAAAKLFGPFTKKTNLTGKDLRRSQVTFNPNSGEPQVSLEFNANGAKLFEEITRKNIGKQVAIFLDNQIISAPRVNEVISGGNAVISGSFKLEEAKNLSIQLNAGALPIPVKIIEQRNIGATLGQDSVQKSVRAGSVGLLIVILFMIANYGKLGLLADFALLIYALFSLAIFKLIPVTLTLPGIAGFILSVGMAVDSNILIFERLKEELKIGRPWKQAIELAFGRAWDSIRDANVTTLITAFILFNPLNWDFLNASGIVRGFALTLALGIFISLFTGIVVTRTLIKLFYRPKTIIINKAN